MNIRKQLFFFLLCVLSFDSNANCIHLLRLGISKTVQSSFSNLFNKHNAKLRSQRANNFLKKLKSIHSKDVIISYNDALVTRDLRQIFNIVANDLFKIEVHFEWAKDLYSDLLTELYLEGNIDYLANFLLHETISKDLIIKVLLERSVEGGFSGLEQDVSILKNVLPPEDFYVHLKSGRYILDENFRNYAHGDIIHILQLDLMIYVLKSHRINPVKSLDLYKWFGEGLEIMNFDGDIDTAWNILFDFEPYYSKITSPEIVSPLYFEFFHIDRNETPSLIKENQSD